MRRQTAFTRLSAALILVAILSSIPARAASTWDLIYTDHIVVTLCNNGCGITLAGADFALLVNTGASNLDAATVFGATFSATSSTPDLLLLPFVNDPGPVITPILPGEAVGSVLAGTNQVLLTKVLPGETFRNAAGLQFLAFQIERTGTNSYVGPVVFDVTMLMGGYMAMFTIRADVGLGESAILFPSAARVTAVPVATPARPTTWGTLKRLYR
jgi:hypothetical protein